MPADLKVADRPRSPGFPVAVAPARLSHTFVMTVYLSGSRRKSIKKPCNRCRLSAKLQHIRQRVRLSYSATLTRSLMASKFMIPLHAQLLSFLTCGNSNLPDGYRCGRYQKAIVTTGRPPTTDSLVPDDLARHLNNAGSEQTGSPSPFISTSNL